jgi:FkbM family methyltransferase
MPASADLAPYGTHPPRGLVRVMLALTRALPANWLGLRISMPLRRLAINALGPRPVDVPLWGARARLYPAGNNCEKYALFTPQMLDVVERAALSAAIDQRMAAGGTFVFIDIGANVGLYSLFVAARAGEGARVLAIEPQPGILDRLRFNCASNPALAIEIVPMAVADREADIEFIVDGRDSGGSHLNKGTDPAASGDTLRVRARPLAAMLADAGMSRIDALKIDIEGAEDLALAPFLREAPAALLPALILIEDRPQDWGADLHALLRDRGYAARARNRHNVVFARGG